MTRDARLFTRLLREALNRGARIEVAGLGTFQRAAGGGYTFKGKSGPKVFIAYVHEDSVHADRLYDELTAEGFDPWMDRRKLLPGQNWPRAIQNAIDTSDFVILCFSNNSVSKRGGFQAEIRYALDCSAQVPLEDAFLIPVRFDECQVPARIQREVQWVDLFPDWGKGFRRVLRILRQRKLRLAS